MKYPQHEKIKLPIIGRMLFVIVFALTIFIGSPRLGLVMAQDAGENDVVVNFVSGAQIVGELAFEVHAFVSAVDVGGNPIPNLTLENFTVAEDGLSRDLTQVAEVRDTPINLILVVDTSQSMSAQGRIDAVKTAASRFVAQMRPEDGVGLVSFDLDVNRQAELTTDHDVVADRIELLSATGAGTCLYDAAYAAVTIAAAVQGRRAVILLTDGADEIAAADGTVKPCSDFLIEDVIAYAAETAHVPVYTVGVGGETDEQSLARLATLTGGLHARAAGPAEIDAYFDLLSKQLGSQYELVYRSTAAPGAHHLVVTLDLNGELLSDGRNFVLPEFAAIPHILSPGGGSEVFGPVQVSADVEGSGDVNRMALLVNGEEVASDATAPFTFQWDSSALAGESVLLEVTIYDSSGEEIARSDPITVVVTAPTPDTATPTATATATPSPTPTLTPTPTPPPIEPGRIVVPLAVVVVLALVTFFAVRRIRTRRRDAFVWQATSGEPVAMLIVEQSDSLPQGRRFDLRKTVTSLGRSAENDIVLPDRPVSRRHAELREQDGVLTIFEVKSTQDGKPVSPRYGTYVNDSPVPDGGLPLADGDRIRLGNRTTLRLERPQAGSEDVTLDLLAEEDRTFDDLAAQAGEEDPDSTREWTDEEAEAQEEAPVAAPDFTREFVDESPAPAEPKPPTDTTRELSPEDEDDLRPTIPKEEQATGDRKTKVKPDRDTVAPTYTDEVSPTDDLDDSTRELDSEDDEPPEDATREL